MLYCSRYQITDEIKYELCSPPFLKFYCLKKLLSIAVCLRFGILIPKNDKPAKSIPKISALRAQYHIYSYSFSYSNIAFRS